VGDVLPAFSLPNQDGAAVSSAALLEKGPLVVSFFRGVWCPYCNIELKALARATPDFEEVGASLVAVSPQTPDWAARTRKTNDLTVDVLSDAGNAYAATLGLRFNLPDTIRDIYTNIAKIELPRYNGDPSWTLPMPARLVIGRDGVIAATDINPDYTHRPDPSETLAIVRDLA
ncbi:MAG: peroxiredoxin-like family protein, partial [Pseudomonadota bacterium]